MTRPVGQIMDKYSRFAIDKCLGPIAFPYRKPHRERRKEMMITGSGNIEMARVLAVRAALRLEIKTGLKRSGRGASTMALANEITGVNARTKGKAYVALNDYIVSILGQSFDRPI